MAGVQLFRLYYEVVVFVSHWESNFSSVNSIGLCSRFSLVSIKRNIIDKVKKCSDVKVKGIFKNIYTGRKIVIHLSNWKRYHSQINNMSYPDPFTERCTYYTHIFHGFCKTFSLLLFTYYYLYLVSSYSQSMGFRERLLREDESRMFKT